MENNNKVASDDRPIGAPNLQPESLENNNTQAPTKPTRKSMSLGKKIFVVGFLTVCAFGLYDSFFPSKNSLTMDELLPKTVSPTTAATPKPSLITPTPTP
jgi:hypothetical protein